MIFGWHYLTLCWYIWFLTDTAEFWLAYLIFGWYVSDCWLTHLTCLASSSDFPLTPSNFSYQPLWLTTLDFFTVTLNFWWALLTFSRHLQLTPFSFSWRLQTFANTFVFGWHLRLWLTPSTFCWQLQLLTDTFIYWLTPSTFGWHLLIGTDTASCSCVRIILIMLSQWQLLSLSTKWCFVNFSYPIFFT